MNSVLVWGIVAAAFVQPIAKGLARLDWRADLIAHLQEQGLALTVAAMVAVRRRRPWLLSLGGIALLQAWPFLRYDGANAVTSDPNSKARLRLVVANVYEENYRFDELIRLVRREKPDVIGLVEVTPRLVGGLAPLHAEYPYRAEYPYGSNGLSLWFRKPPLRVDPPTSVGGEAWPFLHATIEFAGQPRELFLVHPLSPLNRRSKDPRNRELARLARHVRIAGGSRIVAGDLNCTDGSPYFADFLGVSGLRDSRHGFGRQGSWPSFFPPFLRIAIDHVFVSQDLAVTDRHLGPQIGSDHLPVVFELAPASVRDSASHASQSGR